MKSFITVSTLLTFSLFLANCSSSPKAEEETVSEAPMSATDSSSKYASDPVFETDDSESTVGGDSLEDADLGSDQYADDDYGAETSTDLAVGSDLASNRQSASNIKLKAGFYRFGGNCQMKSKPSDNSAGAGVIPANKRLWVDPHNGEWHKVHKKSGPVYIKADCI